jgi:hypothetical protein
LLDRDPELRESELSYGAVLSCFEELCVNFLPLIWIVGVIYYDLIPLSVVVLNTKVLMFGFDESVHTFEL